METSPIADKSWQPRPEPPHKKGKQAPVTLNKQWKEGGEGWGKLPRWWAGTPHNAASSRSKHTQELHLTTALLSGGWVPGASSIGSHILDGDFSHGWQILATQPWAPTPSQRTPELSAISSEKWGSWQMQVIVEVRDHEHHTCFQVSSATERILSTANMHYLTSTPWPQLGGQEYPTGQL